MCGSENDGTSDADLDPLRVGIVGAGEIVDRNRAELHSQAPEVELQTIFDVREWAARDIAERFDVNVADSLDALVGNPNVDIVHVATPHHLHAEQAIAAADAGKHVLVEKPLATTLEATDRVIEACERNDVKLAVLFFRRLRPEVKKARELVSSGVIGVPIGFRIERMSIRKTDQYWEGGYSGRIESDWRGSKTQSGGGVLTMNVIHDVDELLYISDLEPHRIYCESDTFDAPNGIEDLVSATIRFENGGIGSIEASTCVDAVPNRNPVRHNKIYGSEGTIVLDDELWLQTHERTEFGPPEEWHHLTFEAKPDTATPGREFIAEYATAIRNDARPPSPGLDSRQVLSLLEAAYESRDKNEVTPVE